MDRKAIAICGGSLNFREFNWQEGPKQRQLVSASKKG